MDALMPWAQGCAGTANIEFSFQALGPGHGGTAFGGIANNQIKQSSPLRMTAKCQERTDAILKTVITL